MKITYLTSILVFILTGFAVFPAFALDIYIDPKTDQLYGQPAPGRVKLGTLKPVDEANEIPPATPEEIKQEVKKEIKAATKQEVKKEVEAVTKDFPVINTKGKLEFKSRDGNFVWGLGGRLHTQGGIYDDDRADSGESTDFHDNASIRRARLDILATLWKRWQLKLQYDFAGNGDVLAGLRDAWLAYNNEEVWPASAILGHFKETYGLESFNSSNDITFIERALPSRAFSPPDARRLGFGLITHGHDLWTLHTGFYGRNASGEEFGGVELERDDPVVFTGRGTLSPIHTEDKIVHFGFAGSWLSPDNPVRFRERPEMTPGTNRLVDTGLLTNVDSVTRIGVETAIIYGPVSLQGEYMYADVERKGLTNPGFDGWYVQGSWIVTGEPRIYNFKFGTLKNPKPKSIVGLGGIGAWEIAARYSGLDLNNKDVEGGKEENITVGVNWYPHSNFKFMANYVHVLNVKGGPFAGAEPQGVLLRGQVTW